MEEYLLINNANELGEFEIHFGDESDHEKYSCLRPVFKIEEREKNTEYFYSSGYLNDAGIIYECPLSIFYVQIANIHSYIDNELYKNIQSSVIVYSKNFREKKEIKIHLKSYYIGGKVCNERDINEIVNLLNNFIESNLDLSELNDESFELNNNRSGSLTQTEIAQTIENLKFHVFYNDRSRIGKDTGMWKEIEIRNLSTNKYLNFLFKNILSESNIIESITELHDHFFILYDSDFGFIKASGRTEGSDIKKEKEIRDYLKMNINLHYDNLTNNIMSIKL